MRSFHQLPDQHASVSAAVKECALICSAYIICFKLILSTWCADISGLREEVVDSGDFQGWTVDARPAGRAFGRWILFLKLVKCV